MPRRGNHEPECAALTIVGAELPVHRVTPGPWNDYARQLLLGCRAAAAHIMHYAGRRTSPRRHVSLTLDHRRACSLHSCAIGDAGCIKLAKALVANTSLLTLQ